MGRSYQRHTCLRGISRSDSLRRHLESGICKQNEDDEENEAPGENSESQDDNDGTRGDVSEKDEQPKSQTKMKNPNHGIELLNKLTKLQDTFDETSETYLDKNPGMEVEEAENKAFDELKSNYKHALISQYHDLVLP